MYTGTVKAGLPKVAEGAKCGCLGVAAEAMGLAGWQGWMVGPGAPPLAGTPCPSWNRGLDSPLAVVGAALLLQLGIQPFR